MSTPNQPEPPAEPGAADGAQTSPAPVEASAPQSGGPQPHTATYGKSASGKTKLKVGPGMTSGVRNRWDSTDPKARKKLLIAGIVALLTVMAALVTLLFLRGPEEGTIPDKTKVGGVDLGGKTEQEAIEELKNTLLVQSKKPLIVKVEDKTEQLDPAQAGLKLDVNATVDQALHASGGFRLGSKIIKPVVIVDQKQLGAATKKIATKFDEEPVEGGITFQGIKPVLKTPKTGVVVEQTKARQAISQGYMSVDDAGNLLTDPIELPSQVSKPQVSAEAVMQAYNEVAVPAVSAPVIFKEGSRQTTLKPAAYISALGFDPGLDNKLQLNVSGSILAQLLAPALGGAGQKPVNATFVIQGGRPVMVAGKPGIAIDEPALAQAMAVAVVKTDPAQRVVNVSMIQQQPKVTTEALQQLGIKEQVSSFDQHYQPADYRIHNLKQAASSVNGTIVRPGETFSLNQTLGQRTLANGYVEGGVISNGEFGKDVGGGVSTMATTMWTAAFYAGLQRVEQKAHSLYIKRYQAGLEATVNWGTLDMKWKNDTDTAIFITSHAENTYVNVTFWGTKHYDVKAQFGPRRNVVQPTVITKPAPDSSQQQGDDSKRCVPQQGVEGFDITVQRVFTPLPGNPPKSPQTFNTHYDPTPQIVCVSEPEASRPDKRNRNLPIPFVPLDDPNANSSSRPGPTAELLGQISQSLHSADGRRPVGVRR